MRLTGPRDNIYRGQKGRQATGETGWDSDRLAHNPEVAGSNPAPATRQNGFGIMDSGVVFCYL